MQQLASRPRPDQRANTGGAPRSQVVLIVALLLFSVAGLASGFSVGAFTGKHAQPTQSTTQMTSNVPAQKGPVATPKPKSTVKVVALGCPIVEPSSSIYLSTFQVADGATSYTLSAQAVDTTGDQPTKGVYCSTANRPIHTTGITFKLWVIKNVGNRTLSFQNLNNIAQPIDGTANGKDFPELQNKLQFTTPQVQQTNNQGQVTWSYKINPDLKAGMYTLVVLSDWQGKTPNWTWKDLVVNK